MFIICSYSFSDDSALCIINSNNNNNSENTNNNKNHNYNHNHNNDNIYCIWKGELKFLNQHLKLCKYNLLNKKLQLLFKKYKYDISNLELFFNNELININ